MCEMCKESLFNNAASISDSAVTCWWYKCYAQLVFPKRGMCLVFPKRGRCYMRMLQMLSTSVKCLLSAGVLGYWLSCRCFRLLAICRCIGYWQVLCIIVEQLCLVFNCLSPEPETSLSNWKSDRQDLWVPTGGWCNKVCCFFSSMYT